MSSRVMPDAEWVIRVASGSGQVEEAGGARRGGLRLWGEEAEEAQKQISGREERKRQREGTWKR